MLRIYQMDILSAVVAVIPKLLADRHLPVFALSSSFDRHTTGVLIVLWLHFSTQGYVELPPLVGSLQFA